jgi:hypothetical protein
MCEVRVCDFVCQDTNFVSRHETKFKFNVQGSEIYGPTLLHVQDVRM